MRFSALPLGSLRREGDADLTGICADSRLVRPGEVFVCMPSPSRDTHAFLPDVAAAGAVAALVHTEAGFAQARAHGLAAALLPAETAEMYELIGLAAHSVLGEPTADLRVIGVTGTNGKTTTCWLLRWALRALGEPTAYLGTLGYLLEDPLEELSNTTPFPVELAALMARARAEGARSLVMETSSHALAEHRIAGVRFDVGAFTNLTQDHLDYHGTMEAYAEAKRRLFSEVAEFSRAQGKPFRAAINLGDPWGARWVLASHEPPASRRPASDPTLTFGTPESDLHTEAREVTLESILLRARYDGDRGEARLPIGGGFNVANATAALATLLALGYPLEPALRALEQVRPAPGRFEPVPNQRGIGVLVDYAHTPDALEKLLQATRDLGPQRILCVFGCGGDRDRTKRPKMASVVSRLADLPIATSDNPRTEDPERILDDVVAGLEPGREHLRIADRREAVAAAIRAARPGDVVVIAGKGHENYQIIGTTKHPMDDRDLAREALA